MLQSPPPFASSLGGFLGRVLFVHMRLRGNLFMLRRALDLGPTIFGPVEMEELPPRLIGAFISVRPEVIPLRLKQVGGKSRGTVAIIVRQSAHEGRRGHAVGRRQADDATPVPLPALDL